MNLEKSNELRSRFHNIIPGGAHTYAKGDDQFPEKYLPILARGNGCHVWDVDGNEFIEYSMGLRAVTLGHAHPRVTEAAYQQMKLGSNFNRPAMIELECAEMLSSLIPGAEMVKFAKNGSDATSAAIKLSRAYTGRELIAICSDHPFFSVDDWFMGTTAINTGIPKVVQSMTKGFRYNDLASVEALFAQHRGHIACLIMEAEKTDPPADGFLHRVKELCRQEGTVFILDEMITGFRWHNSGAQAYHDITADLVTFGKAFGNGFAVSALVGRRDIMRLGGLDHDQERVFLLSLTHGAEYSGLAAAREVMKIYQEEPVVETMWRQGARLREELEPVIRRHGLEEYFPLSGRPCCLMYGTLDADRNPSQGFRALFLQETIRRGLIAPSFIMSYSHTDADIERTVEIVDASLETYSRALSDGIDDHLIGRPVKPVFRKLS